MYIRYIYSLWWYHKCFHHVNELYKDCSCFFITCRMKFKNYLPPQGSLLSGPKLTFRQTLYFSLIWSLHNKLFFNSNHFFLIVTIVISFGHLHICHFIHFCLNSVFLIFQEVAHQQIPQELQPNLKRSSLSRIFFKNSSQNHSFDTSLELSHIVSHFIYTSICHQLILSFLKTALVLIYFPSFNTNGWVFWMYHVCDNEKW